MQKDVCVHCGRNKAWHDVKWRMHNFEAELGKPKMSKALSPASKRALVKSQREFGF